ncbi:extracellular metallo proteinase 1 [Dactylonectria macrodidyma]|uniref:Extracellular metalloproteinase n=1 Tax=Dactylonectria macrodidyma TaxID=307937 RepID=A0A9P9JIY1_9HYPO|nr:extracellular metallo proteinase 1 [Dactylonectria macrodidyma]
MPTYSKGNNYVDAATNFVKAMAPGVTFRTNDDYYVGTNGVGHVYFTQTWMDRDVAEARFNVNVAPDGTILSYGNTFDSDKYSAFVPSNLHRRVDMNPVEALKGVVKALSLPFDVEHAKAKPQLESEHKTVRTRPESKDRTARFIYHRAPKGGFMPAWQFETRFGSHYYFTYIEAMTNTQILSSEDLVSHSQASFKVYPWNLNSPADGPRDVVRDPWNIESSPFTWLSNGVTNFTTLAGNNGISHRHAGASPEAGWMESFLEGYAPKSRKHKFEFDYDVQMEDPENYCEASITQLFYTGNKCHDLYYALGFNEAAGNFQTNNDGKGGESSDPLWMDAESKSAENNAYFVPSPDGEAALLVMGLFTSSKPTRDPAFVREVVIHEYTHGLSNRLVGGPSTTECLRDHQNSGMDEGWSDFMAIAVGIKPGDTRRTDMVFGGWDSSAPGGFRDFPYSTDMFKNPMTFGQVDWMTDYYSIGNFWAVTLYEAMWNLIDKHGLTDEETPEFRNSTSIPTDGRYLAMKLVMDSMALLPCLPTILQARDALIDADRVLTDGENACELWRAFARRGLGTDAEHVAPKTRVQYRKESFRMPSDVSCKKKT